MAHLDRKTGDMEAVREQDPLPQQPLISCSKLNLRDGEGMSQMQGPVHIGVRKCPKPLRKLLLDLGGGETRGFGL